MTRVMLRTGFAAAACVAAEFEVGLNVAHAQCVVATLEQNSGTAGDQFGNAVAIDGDHMLVGAKFYDENGTNSGAVFVYRRSNGNWTQLGKLYPPGGPHLGDYFGVSVAISGDRAIVGAMKSDYAGANAGAAFVYDWIPSISTWQLAATLVPPQLEFDQGFGFSVDIDGGTAVVGAYLDDMGPGAGLDAGSAWVYQRNSSGSWSAGTQLWPGTTSPAPGDNFGYSVAIRDGLVAVGAPAQDGSPVGSAPDSGRVYVFQIIGSGYQEIYPYELSSAGDRFGHSVEIDGRVLAVGAPYDDELGVDSGAVFLFEHHPQHGFGADPLDYLGKLNSNAPQVGARFGCSVAKSGDVLAVGICDHSTAGAVTGGAVAPFRRIGASSASNWKPESLIVPAGTMANDNVGYSVAVDDPLVVIGSPNHDTTLSNAGRAVILDYANCPGVYTIPTTIPLWSAGAQQFLVNGGIGSANRSYLLLGSASGTTPGINLGAAHLPLNVDALTIAMLSSPGLLGIFAGSLDASGRAMKSLHLPLNLPASALGVEIDYAALIYSPNHALPKTAIGPWRTAFRELPLEPPLVSLSVNYIQGYHEVAYKVAPLVQIYAGASANTQGPPNSIVQFIVDFGDGTTGSSYIENHQYPTGGKYTVTATAVDSLGAGAVTTHEVSINKMALGVFSYPQTVVAGQPATFNGSQSFDPDGVITKYEWDFGDSSLSTPSAIVTHTYPTWMAGQTVTVRLTVVDDDGLASSNIATHDVNIQ